MGATGLGLLVLSYATALPWLLRGEAVDLVPFLCALVFGCCLIRPVTLAFERASKRAKALAVTLLALLAAAIATAVAGGHVSVKKVDASANAVTIIGSIDNLTSDAISTQWASQDYISDGTQWYRV